MTDTAQDLAREAERLYLDAALMLTKMDARMRRACHLVLIDKLTPSEAARRVKRQRQNVYRALKRVEPKIAEVKSYALTQ